ncbi:hypothetical protein BDR04DRAFT_1189497 [Suillus decipiens]|nr:hypothetical protein BDR04DRAFT_1189497 [Suillus decipiens]
MRNNSGLTHARLKTHFYSLGNWVPRDSGHHRQSQQPVQAQKQYQNLQTPVRAYQTSSYRGPNKVKISCNPIGLAQPTGVVQNWTLPQPDIISEQKKRSRDSIEDMPPRKAQNAEKKHQMMNNTTDSAEDMPLVPQSAVKRPGTSQAAKTESSQVQAVEDGQKAIEKLEEPVNWINNETRILLDAPLLAGGTETLSQIQSRVCGQLGVDSPLVSHTEGESMPVDIGLRAVVSCQLIGRRDFIRADGQGGRR